MKAVVTGHTKGIGREVYHFLQNKGYEVLGISRQTGYDLSQDLDKVIEVASGCDIFVNNTKLYQTDLLERLYNKVDKIIVMGSIIADYHFLINNHYSKQKSELQSLCYKLNLLPSTNILYLKISMLEDAVSSDMTVSFDDVIKLIDFWLKNPSISSVDYHLKLTEHTILALQEKYDIDQEKIDRIILQMCERNKKEFK